MGKCEKYSKTTKEGFQRCYECNLEARKDPTEIRKSCLHAAVNHLSDITFAKQRFFETAGESAEENVVKIAQRFEKYVKEGK